MPLDQGRDIAVLRSANQVAFSVTRNSAILDGCRPFADGHSIFNLAITVALQAGVLGTPDCAFCAQVRQQLLFENATCLYIKASIDSLV